MCSITNHILFVNANKIKNKKYPTILQRNNKRINRHILIALIIHKELFYCFLLEILLIFIIILPYKTISCFLKYFTLRHITNFS